MLAVRPIALSLLVTALLAGCAAGPPAPDRQLAESAGFATLTPDPQDGADRVWPAPPEQPRFRYIGQLIGEQNLPHKPRSVVSKVFGWLTGLGSRKAVPRELQRPQGVYVADDGRIYVTDVSRAAVYVFDDARGELQVWEMATDQLRFEAPVAVVALSDGDLLVTDSRLGRVVRLAPDGTPRGFFGDSAFERPTGLARDRQRKRIYVADRTLHVVRVFDEQGRQLDEIGGFGTAAGQFNAPTHLHFSRGRLYVSDTLNARVQVFDAAGSYLDTIGRRGLYVGDMPRPKGVATDRHGHVYVLESYYDYLLVFNDQGEFLLPVGGTGSGVGEFYLPGGVWVDRHDRVFIADGFNGRIVILQYLGQT